jgi:hypothetical protein
MKLNKININKNWTQYQYETLDTLIMFHICRSYLWNGGVFHSFYSLDTAPFYNSTEQLSKVNN